MTQRSVDEPVGPREEERRTEPASPASDSEDRSAVSGVPRQKRGSDSPVPAADLPSRQAGSAAGFVGSASHVARSGSNGASPARERVPLPEVGEVVFGFRLLRDLGRGSFARVYLAEQ